MDGDAALSLGIGGLLVDAVGIETLFWTGGSLLVMAGALGLPLLGCYDLRVLALSSGGSCSSAAGA